MGRKRQTDAELQLPKEEGIPKQEEENSSPSGGFFPFGKIPNREESSDRSSGGSTCLLPRFESNFHAMQSESSGEKG